MNIAPCTCADGRLCVECDDRLEIEATCGYAAAALPRPDGRRWVDLDDGDASNARDDAVRRLEDRA